MYGGGNQRGLHQHGLQNILPFIPAIMHQAGMFSGGQAPMYASQNPYAGASSPYGNPYSSGMGQQQFYSPPRADYNALTQQMAAVPSPSPPRHGGFSSPYGRLFGRYMGHHLIDHGYTPRVETQPQYYASTHTPIRR